ncbi:MAG: hypothetical protein LBV64_07125 [Mediterranea sp.]|nr:hypothetical protein [Mediterranea sp.]
MNLEIVGFDNYVGNKFRYGSALKECELLFPLPASELNNNNLYRNTGY